MNVLIPYHLTDNLLNVHQLLKEGNCDEAQIVLEGYLRKQIKVGAKFYGEIQGSEKLTETTTENIGKTIDEQINKIEISLQK